MSREEFCNQYISVSAERAMAKVVLPDTTMSLIEWQSAWARMKQSPA